MIRRNFLKGISLLSTGVLGTPQTSEGMGLPPNNDRDHWVTMVTKISRPVLKSLSQDTLKDNMPVESAPGQVEGRKKVTYLEALGRTLAGLAPWLELGPDNTIEGQLRKEYIELSTLAIHNAVTPSSRDFMNFTEEAQPLVDAAFLAHALIRAPRQLWSNLDTTTQQHLAAALRSTRVIKPYYSNWLLFSAMVEAALLKFTGEFDAMRVDYAVRQHEAWYKGDGVYGDGPAFHFDYYNSYVIHPCCSMLFQP